MAPFIVHQRCRSCNAAPGPVRLVYHPTCHAAQQGTIDARMIATAPPRQVTSAARTAMPHVRAGEVHA